VQSECLQLQSNIGTDKSVHKIIGQQALATPMVTWSRTSLHMLAEPYL